MVYGLNIENPYLHDIAVKMLDGDVGKVSPLDKTPDGGFRIYGPHSGRQVETKFLPTKMEWGHSSCPVPDFDRHSLITVSSRTKDIIETLEPSLHQFVQIDCYDKGGEQLQPRFVLIPSSRIDSLDHDLTTMVLFRGRMWRTAKHLMRRHQDAIPAGFDVNAAPKLVFSKEKIGDRHLWVDKHLDTGGVWLSGELGVAFKEAGLTGLKLSEIGLEVV